MGERTKPYSLYLAGMFSTIATRKAQAAELRALGFVVTSHWIDETVPHTVEMKDVPDKYHEETALIDIEDIEAADALVMFVPTDKELVDATVRSSSRGGRHVELGYAIKANKDIFVIGCKENVFHYLPFRMIHLDTFNDLKQYLMEIKEVQENAL